MSWWIWLLIVPGVLIFIGFLIWFFTRNSGESPGGLSSAISSIRGGFDSVCDKIKHAISGC